jgi:hypothetical protein
MTDYEDPQEWFTVETMGEKIVLHGRTGLRSTLKLIIE